MPTAVMCSNDMTAIGVLHKVSRQLRVPDNLSVIGFDDIHMARVTIPPLTSIQMSRLELARAAVTALRAHVENTVPIANTKSTPISSCPGVNRLSARRRWKTSAGPSPALLSQQTAQNRRIRRFIV